MIDVMVLLSGELAMIGVVRALGKLTVSFAVFMLQVAAEVVLVVVAVSLILAVAELTDRNE